MSERPKKLTPFTIAIETEGKPETPLDAAVYLFDAAGALIASAPLKDGRARLAPERVSRSMRLLVGPALDQDRRDSAPTLATLESLDAYQPKWRYEPGREIYELGPIPQTIWPHWPLCRCRVRGRVVKRRYSPGGVVVEAPVCNARVHICEVDRLPWVILRLPDPDILRIRDDLIRIIREPIPWPPDPDPGPLGELDLHRIDAIARRQKALVRQVASGSRFDAAALNPQPLPPKAKVRLSLSRADQVAFNPQPDPPEDPFRRLSPAVVVGFDPQPEPPAQFAQLPATTQFALNSGAASVVRRALIDNLDIIRPFICRWPWLHPWFYRCDELRVVTTDEDGRFDTSIWYPCRGDRPDLYFWVEASIGGAWTTVYRPPIPCHVWWDYPCGTEVTITVTDPRVTGCGPRPEVSGKQVVVKSIAREVSMGEINREPSPANPLADPAKAGTVMVGWIDASRESPFGDTLEPRVDFGDGLKPAGITHYRWSYRTLGSASEADWRVIDAPVSRHYRETTPALAPVVYKSVQIGPAPGVAGYFVEVDPALPAGGEDWEILDERYDLASAYWATAGVSPGKYELKLELFRNAGGTMTRVDLTAEAVGLQQIIDPAPLTAGTYVTQAATHDRLLIDPGTGHAVGFRLVLQVDNRVCFGTIPSVVVAPGVNDTRCGFLEYAPGAQATIAFRASHPAQYASFDFDLARVATLLASGSATGLVDAASANGFSRSGDTFSKAIPVTALFSEGLPAGETPCIRAAFAEALHVAALATDGYGRLSALDAPRTADPAQVALRAFALTPQEVMA